MKYILANNSPIKLQLSRNLTRDIKRGQKWVYANALRNLPLANPGSLALLVNNKGGTPIGYGFYNPNDAIPLRMCTTSPKEKLSDEWVEHKMGNAKRHRNGILQSGTSVYRLFNGEGDDLPGLVCDIYDQLAAIKLDGPSPSGFWNVAGIAEWLKINIGVTCVYQRFKSRKKKEGIVLLGKLPPQPIPVIENNIPIEVDIINGQKTGLFIDQRDNRKLIQSVSKNLTVLNIFGYTGGFSVSAGIGGATQVTTVDIAKPAISAANDNWKLAGLPAHMHDGIAEDAFEFLEQSKQKWDMVILDPPSFAHNQASVDKAINAYIRLFTLGVKRVKNEGYVAFSSCSSHIAETKFIEIIQQSVSNAKLKPTILHIGNQPIDHPHPMQMPNLRYLKFILCQIS
jgi:23S rRNA (cytosine1962-C5)-methyltransferase